MCSSICEKFYEFYETESHPLAAGDFPAAPREAERERARHGHVAACAPGHRLKASAHSSKNAAQIRALQEAKQQLFRLLSSMTHKRRNTARDVRNIHL